MRKKKTGESRRNPNLIRKGKDGAPKPAKKKQRRNKSVMAPPKRRSPTQPPPDDKYQDLPSMTIEERKARQLAQWRKELGLDEGEVEVEEEE